MRQQNGPAVAEDEVTRERNLPNHFKGEDGGSPVLAVSTASLPQLPQQPGDPSDDYQLKTALDTLRTWQIFRATLLGNGPKAASATP